MSHASRWDVLHWPGHVLTNSLDWATPCKRSWPPRLSAVPDSAKVVRRCSKSGLGSSVEKHSGRHKAHQSLHTGRRAQGLQLHSHIRGRQRTFACPSALSDMSCTLLAASLSFCSASRAALLALLDSSDVFSCRRKSQPQNTSASTSALGQAAVRFTAAQGALAMACYLRRVAEPWTAAA